MRRLLFKFLLGPLLVLQGWWVRYKTPKLPEPVIRTDGRLGTGPSLKLLLLGDSSAAGVGAETASESLLGQLIAQLKTDYELSYQILAETGKTTAEMIADIDQMPAQKIDVVITALGVNDVTSQVTPHVWQEQQRALIQKLDKRFKPDQILMSGLPPVRDFPALMWPLNAFLGDSADQLDRKLQQLSETAEKVVFHSLRNYPPEAKAAVDGFHPGPEVYRLWAQNLAALIKSHQSPEQSR